MKKICTLILLFSSIIYTNIFAQSVLDKIDSKMIHVPGGIFEMGSTGFEKNEKPVHQVYVNSFMISQTEVSQAEYFDVMGQNLSHFVGKNLPVEEVSWYDAIVFCNKLSIKKNLEPAYSLNGKTNPDDWGKIPRKDDSEESKSEWNQIVWNTKSNGYRLPTEAEWEYAAKKDSSATQDFEKSTWHKDNSSQKTHPIAQTNPNPLGLYDMGGNVWEWCWDWYTRYNQKSASNPLGGMEENSGRKVRKGGSFKSDPIYCRKSNRASSVPEIRGRDLGFRIARSIEKTEIQLDKELLECIKNLPVNVFYDLNYFELADFEKLNKCQKDLAPLMLNDFFGEQISEINSGLYAEFSQSDSNKSLVMVVAKSNQGYFSNKTETFARDFMDGVYESSNFLLNSKDVTYSAVQPFGQIVLCGTNQKKSLYILIYAQGFDKKSLQNFMDQCEKDLTLLDVESVRKVFDDLHLEQKKLLKISAEKLDKNQWNVQADFDQDSGEQDF